MIEFLFGLLLGLVLALGLLIRMQSNPAQLASFLSTMLDTFGKLVGCNTFAFYVSEIQIVEDPRNASGPQVVKVRMDQLRDIIMRAGDSA